MNIVEGKDRKRGSEIGEVWYTDHPDNYRAMVVQMKTKDSLTDLTYAILWLEDLHVDFISPDHDEISNLWNSFLNVYMVRKIVPSQHVELSIG